MPAAGMAGRLSSKAPHSKGAVAMGRVLSRGIRSAFEINMWLGRQVTSWTGAGRAARAGSGDLAENELF